MRRSQWTRECGQLPGAFEWDVRGECDLDFGIALDEFDEPFEGLNDLEMFPGERRPRGLQSERFR